MGVGVVEGAELTTVDVKDGDDFAVLNLATAEYQIIEYLATDETDKGTARKEFLVAQTEFYARKNNSRRDC